MQMAVGSCADRAPGRSTRTYDCGYCITKRPRMMCRHCLARSRHMKAIRKILVAVKNTRQKRCPAVIKAATLAHALRAQLELFHVISGPVAIEAFAAGAMEKVQEKERALQLARLEKIAAPLRGRGINVSTAVEWDFPSHEA